MAVNRDSAIVVMAWATALSVLLCGVLTLLWWIDDESEQQFIERQTEAIQSMVQIRADIERMRLELELIRSQNEPVAVLPRE